MQNPPKNEIIAHLSSLGLGLKRKSVTVDPYKSGWAEAFLFLKRQIELCFAKEFPYQIEHVGSTSIPGLSSKPVLDLLIILKDKALLSKAISLLESIGFTYKGDAISRVTQTEPDLDRHFFSFYDDEKAELATDFIHVHMFFRGHTYIEQLLYFRDRMRADKHLRNDYQNLKIQLWQDGNSRSDYTRSKENFIAKILAELNIATDTKTNK